MKFKVGDKVRGKLDDFPYSPEMRGKELIIEKLHKNDDGEYVGIDLGNMGWYQFSRFELVINNEEELLKKANEGRKALVELAKTGRLMSKNDERGEFKHPLITMREYFLEEKIKAKSFHLEQYLVKLKKPNYAKVGCQEFKLDELRYSLHDLLNDKSNSHDWMARKSGIYHTKAKGGLTWDEAKKLLTEIEEFLK